jgi:hypothetical protein
MSFDEMKYEDFSWIRWDRIRWDFVRTIVSANQNHVGEDRGVCTSPDCCLDMAQMFPTMGLNIRRDGGGNSSGISFNNELGELITSAMRDGLFMVSTYVQFGLEHPLEGHMEAPWEVARIANSSYFTNANRDGKLAPHVSDEPSDEISELLFAFVKLAFPNDFLTAIHEKNSGTSSTSGHQLNKKMIELFESNQYVFPMLSTEIISGLRGFPEGSLAMTEHFGSMEEVGKWSDIAGYHLGLGMEDASLRRYWEDFSSIPDAFVYSERGNGYGTGMGFIVRSSGLFVSQQVWEDDESKKWNLCTKSFNANLASILEKSSSSGAAMVVFSDYRGDSYIVSSVEKSWDEYAPMSAVLGPLPEGFGIVGVWTNYDEARYTPRSFDEIIEADWSEQITASAKYLRDCLAAIEATKAKS